MKPVMNGGGRMNTGSEALRKTAQFKAAGKGAAPMQQAAQALHELEASCLPVDLPS